MQKIPGSKYGAFFLYPGNNIILTKDAGKTFTTCSPIGFRYGRSFFLNEKKGWHVGVKVAATNDGGMSWDTLADSLPADTSSFFLRTVFFTDTLHGWIGGYTCETNSTERIILKTTDGGRAWARQNNITASGDFSMNPAVGTPSYCILKIRSRDGIRVWALDQRSGVLFSEDGGEHWEEQYLPCSNQRFTDMYFHNDNHI